MDICRFRAGPQDLSVAADQITSCVAAYATVDLLLLSRGADIQSALLLTAADTGLLMALCYGILVWYRVAQRFPQTLTALTGCSALLSVLEVPVLWWLDRLQAMHADATLALLALLLIGGWSVAVVGHVLRHALSVGLFRAMVYSVVYFYLAYWLAGWLAPVSG